jgi:hypothetical protein
MYLSMRGSLLMFYGSKHGSVKIYLAIYLEKIKKQSIIIPNTIFQLYRIVVVSFISGENHPPVASHWQTLSDNVVSSTSRLSGIQTLVLICTDSYISNYHTITTAPIIGLVKIRSLKWPSAMVKVYIVL